MAPSVRRRLQVYGVAGCLMLVVSAGWWHHLRVERAYANASLLQAVAEIDLADTTLRLIDQGRIDTAREILMSRIDSSVSSTERSRYYGASLYPIVIPNLTESMHRAAERARLNQQPELAQRIDSLVEYIDESSREPLVHWWNWTM